MDLTTHASIITAPKGTDLASYVSKNIITPSDLRLDLHEHKKDKGTSIGIFVDDIRAMEADVRTAKKDQRTIVIISDAAKMNIQAQSALLKILEEPRDNLYFILLTTEPQVLTATIRSRCQLIQLKLASEPSIALPKDIESRVKFMARGSHDEIKRLVNDEAYRLRKQKLYEEAKQFVSASNYNKLAFVSVLQARERSEVIDFLDATIHMYGIVLHSHFSEKTLRQTKALLRADEAIRQNGHIRTQLLKTVL